MSGQSEPADVSVRYQLSPIDRQMTLHVRVRRVIRVGVCDPNVSTYIIYASVDLHLTLVFPSVLCSLFVFNILLSV